MRRRELLGLGIALGTGRGRTDRTGTVLLGMVLALVWATLLAVCALPGLVTARTETASARTVDSVHLRPDREPLLLAARKDMVGGREVSLWYVVSDGTGSHPPGIDHLPAPGQSMVSPALAARLDEPEGRGVARRLGTVVGRIGQEGLVAPDEVVAYVGAERTEVERVDPQFQPPTQKGSGWGVPAPDTVTTTGRWTAGILAVLAAPLVAVVMACLRLSAVVRDRQLAALRLLGLSRDQVTHVLVGTLLVPIGAGLLAGTALFVGAGRTVAGHGVAGRTWWAADLRPSPWALVPAALLVAGLLAVARARVRPVIDAPLVARRDRPPFRPRRWHVVPLVAGLGGFALVVGASSTTIIRDDVDIGTRPFAIHVAATALTAVGALLAAPHLCHLLGRAVGRRSERVAPHLAGRAVAADPRGASTVCGAIGLVVVLGVLGTAFGATLAEGATNLVEQPPGVTVVVGPGEATLDALRSALPDAHVVPVWPGPEAWSSAVVARCQDLRTVDPRLDGCVAGASSYRFPLFDGAGGPVEVAGRTVTPSEHDPILRLPEQNWTQPFGGLVRERLVDPGPIDDALLGPPDRILVGGRYDPAAVSAVLAEHDPLAQVATEAMQRRVFRVEQAVDDRAARALLVGVGGAMVALLVVTSLERAAARRAHEGRLAALGVPRGTIRRSSALAAWLPVGAVLPACALAGVLSDLAWDRVIHRPLAVDPVLGVLLLGATLASALAGLVAARTAGAEVTLRRE